MVHRKYGECPPVVPREGQPSLPVDKATRKLIEQNQRVETWPGLMLAMEAAPTVEIQQRLFELLSATLKHQPKANELGDVHAFIAKMFTEERPTTMDAFGEVLSR